MLHAITHYLESLNFGFKLNSFLNEYQSHPDYPSLLAVSDGLTAVSLENIVANIPFTHIDQLPQSFVTQLHLNITEFYNISKTANGFYFLNEQGRKVKLTNEELATAWTGIVVLIDDENTNIKKLNFKENYYYIVLLFVGFFSVIGYNYGIQDIVLMIISIVGIYFSIAILKIYFKEQEMNESKWCTARKNFSCNSVINSKSYFFSKYVEFVDLPIIFFGVILSALFLNINSFSVVGLMSLLATPMIVYSIYIQKFQLKKWCMLCLGVSSLLALISFLFLYNYSRFEMSIINVAKVIVLFLALGSVWFFIKKILIEKNLKSNEVNNLLRFKRNVDLFQKVSEKVGNIEDFQDLKKMEIGNKEANNTLTLFLSPSCHYCHSSYKEALVLLEKSKGTIKLEVCFNINVNNSANPFIPVVSIIQQLFHEKKNFKEALDDWHIKNTPLEKWVDKWKSNDNFESEHVIINQQFEWCLNNSYNYAPVIIFNNYLLPKIYEIKELIYFIED
jgi:RNA polymerase subunit RPABC4/transcription elongation factor Spt4